MSFEAPADLSILDFIHIDICMGAFAQELEMFVKRPVQRKGKRVKMIHSIVIETVHGMVKDI